MGLVSRSVQTKIVKPGVGRPLLGPAKTFLGTNPWPIKLFSCLLARKNTRYSDKRDKI